MKLLIDECLSPELVRMARERGHGESSHVVWIGRQGINDWDLLKIVLEGDWTLVTRNGASLARATRTRSAASITVRGLLGRTRAFNAALVRALDSLRDGASAVSLRGSAAIA
jgi:hypothetical protein